MTKYQINYRSAAMGRYDRASVVVKAKSRFTAVRAFLRRMPKRCEVWIMSVLNA